jgi:hypothetical protein
MSDEDERFVDKMAGGGDPKKVPADAQQVKETQPEAEEDMAGGGDPKKVPTKPPSKSTENGQENI